jgi:L-ascorbate metabolism protein UlaG (beta-lactamase superfamily)
MPEYLEGIYWIHHSAVRIEYENRVIYIDPYLLDNPKPADFIFITHEHQDHCSPADIRKIMKPGTQVICSRQCAKALGEFNPKIVKPGDIFTVASVTCEAVPAYNNKKPFHQKKDEKVGYIFNLGDRRIYHAGDTDFIPEMNELKNITVAMVPIGGFTTMDQKEAAQAIRAIQPKAAMPLHYGSFKGIYSLLFSNRTDEFVALVEGYGIPVAMPPPSRTEP